MHQQPYSGVTRVGDTRGGDWGCHPSIFSRKTWQPFFQSPVLRCHPWFLLRKNWRPFLLIALSLSLGCHPPRGCHRTHFLPVRPRFSTILCKFTHKFFSFGCHPLGPPPSPPPIVTPLTNAVLWPSLLCTSGEIQTVTWSLYIVCYWFS